MKDELLSYLIRGLAILLGVLALLALASILAAGVSTPRCTNCHEDVAVRAQDSPHRDIACLDCHKGATPIQRIGFRMTVLYGMRLHLIPVTESSAKVVNASCESCHDVMSLSGTQTNNGIVISHKTCADGQWCIKCHASVGHPSDQIWASRYAMDACLNCHTQQQVDATSGCSLCHDGRFNGLPTAAASTFGVVHGPNWQTTHGLGDWNTCRSCHASDFCARCHGGLVPHDVTIVGTHGRTARLDASKCDTCHRDERFCADCHQIEIPHPDGFLSQHSQITAQRGQQICNNCHVQMDCDNCHRAHIHPGGARL